MRKIKKLIEREACLHADEISILVGRRGAVHKRFGGRGGVTGGVVHNRVGAMGSHNKKRGIRDVGSSTGGRWGGHFITERVEPGKKNPLHAVKEEHV